MAITLNTAIKKVKSSGQSVVTYVIHLKAPEKEYYLLSSVHGCISKPKLSFVRTRTKSIATTA
jgi:hypothetical protein